MKALELSEIPQIEGSVCAIGTFDGVHRGHLAVIGKVRETARELDLESVVVTFDVHPMAVIRNIPPRRILSLESKVRLIGELGIDHVIPIRFGRDIAQISAEDFTDRVFFETLNASRIVLGFNNCFGKDRRGDVAFLNEYAGLRRGFRAVSVGPVYLDDELISSTRVRETIQKNDLDLAERMLSRKYFLEGRVKKGEGRGASIGVPTANLDLFHEIIPPNGVYGVLAEFEGQRHPAVMNIGENPTFHAEHIPTKIEVHVLDFSADLLGKTVIVTPLKYLRPEMKFDGVASLVAQIHADIASFRVLFRELQSKS
ncbi:MAG: riboflavin biosynthesis protein RibF [Planctomycetes bacterium]|nr:riboflavin biosynthesis protein RibF [Planctomycetota bacterium]